MREGHHKSDVSCDTLNFTNLLKSYICYNNNHKSTSDLFLTNKSCSFQFFSVTQTVVSDFYRLITPFMKSHFLRLKAKIIHYCNLNRFNEWKFAPDVKSADFSFEKDYYNKHFSVLTNTFSLIVKNHAPLTKNTVRGTMLLSLQRVLQKPSTQQVG